MVSDHTKIKFYVQRNAQKENQIFTNPSWIKLRLLSMNLI